ncbi:MAG: 1-phosphofructokinase [Clostridia bacterium BRH_c25]|nr:MAG: 1-phosphofructokinase [Clostridia bacterium BRH_c25]
MIKTVTMNPAIDKTVEIKNFRVGTVNRISSVRIDAGGKGINVSKTIKALGGSSLATGILAGRNGEYIKSYLDHMGIDNDFLFVNGETRTNVKVVDKLNHTNTDINEPGFNVTVEDLSLIEKKIFSGLNKESILVLSGSIPAEVSPCIYKEWTERARKFGARVMLDSDGELLKEGIKASPYLIKPNIGELERLFGRKLGNIGKIVEAARSLLEAGVEIVAVSLGAEGAVFVGRNKAIHTEGLAVDVRSTVGAGDAMVASLALAVFRGYSFERAVTLSAAAGAANVATDGTQPPLLEDVLRYEGQVHFSYLK